MYGNFHTFWFVDWLLNIVCVFTGLTNCKLFQTTISNQLTGILCDHSYVNGYAHPFKKIRGKGNRPQYMRWFILHIVDWKGNVVYNMLLSMTIDLKLKKGLWCSNVDNCQFESGGMFTTTTVKQLLFQGFSDPSILSYLNSKHVHHKVRFSCRENGYDHCGKELLRCNEKGIFMSLPNSSKYVCCGCRHVQWCRLG